MLKLFQVGFARKIPRSSINAVYMKAASHSTCGLRTIGLRTIGLRTASLRSEGMRGYSSGGSKDEMPKWRYFFLIMALGSAGFLASLKLVGNKKSRHELSDEDLEKLKPKAAKATFDPKDTFVVFVLGGPGSGKGTQCDKIVKDYNFCHLSVGDLLRTEQNRPESKYGGLIKTCIKNGEIVPQEVTIGLLEKAMEEAKQKGTHHFLIDGFPRKMDQALTFEEHIVTSKFTLFFECPEAVMLQRLLKRGETSGRSDDNIDSIRQRFKTFVDQSMPVVNYFDTAGKVATLSCNEPVDQVYAKVQEKLKEHGVEPRS